MPCRKLLLLQEQEGERNKMSKRSLANDKVESEEEHDKEQAVVQALALNDLMAVVQDIGQLVHVFRFHPRRFLGLMTASKSMRTSVEMAQRGGGAAAMWYKFCLYSFPDYIIALKAQDYSFLPKLGHTFEEISDGLYPVDWSLQRVPFLGRPGWKFLFGQDDMEVNHNVFHWEPSAFVQLYLHETTHKKYMPSTRMWYRRLDRSFTSEHIRKACLNDEKTAIGVATIFRAMFPFAIPPAQYCFASQFTLHHLCMELLHLTLDSSAVFLETIQRFLLMWVVSIVQHRTLYPADVTLFEAVETKLKYATVSDINSWEAQYLLGDADQAIVHPLICTGKGPNAEHATPPDFSVRIDAPTRPAGAFSLRDLAVTCMQGEQLWLEQMAAVTDDGQRALLVLKLHQYHDLTERAILASLRYSENDAMQPSKYTVRDVKYQHEWATKQFETKYDWQGERATDLELYGSHNPLYWDVLLRDLKRMEDYDWFHSLSAEAQRAALVNDQHAFQFYETPGDWRQPLMDLLKIAGNDKTNEKYLSLSSTVVPHSALKCTHCDSARPTVATVRAPFHAFCDKECQRAALLAHTQ